MSSDTAKELSDRLRNALSDPFRASALYVVACSAIDRVRRLERGIERLVRESRLVETKDTLMQLIEELGNE